MNNERRTRLRQAARLADEAKSIIDDILTEEPDQDAAISFPEDGKPTPLDQAAAGLSYSRGMTTLELWLAHRGIGCIRLARDLGVSKEAVYRLALPRGQARSRTVANFDILRALWQHTGIRPGVLVEDAMGIGGGDGVDTAIEDAIKAGQK